MGAFAPKLLLPSVLLAFPSQLAYELTPIRLRTHSHMPLRVACEPFVLLHQASYR
jgi:hypothetical protein